MVLKRVRDTDMSELGIFSQDEKKQDDMRRTLNSSKVKFFTGDVWCDSDVNGSGSNGGRCSRISQAFVELIGNRN